MVEAAEELRLLVRREDAVAEHPVGIARARHAVDEVAVGDGARAGQCPDHEAHRLRQAGCLAGDPAVAVKPDDAAPKLALKPGRAVPVRQPLVGEHLEQMPVPEEHHQHVPLGDRHVKVAEAVGHTDAAVLEAEADHLRIAGRRKLEPPELFRDGEVGGGILAQKTFAAGEEFVRHGHAGFGHGPLADLRDRGLIGLVEPQGPHVVPEAAMLGGEFFECVEIPRGDVGAGAGLRQAAEDLPTVEACPAGEQGRFADKREGIEDCHGKRMRAVSGEIVNAAGGAAFSSRSWLIMSASPGVYSDAVLVMSSRSPGGLAVPQSDTTFSNDADDQTARAYRSIRRMILDGGLLPSHRTSHRNLAEQLGIGRSPVRDAILQLETEGLVVQRGQRGILLREPTPTEFTEIYELRLVMEPFFAERAALLATPVQLAAMASSCEHIAAIAARPKLEAWLKNDEHYRRLFQLDMQFHATILAAAGNSIAVQIFTSGHVLAHAFAWTGTPVAAAKTADRLQSTAAEHAAIYEAICDRDPAAARERMRQHVLDAIPAVTARYAQAVEADAEAAERSAATRAAAAVRRPKTR